MAGKKVNTKKNPKGLLHVLVDKGELKKLQQVAANLDMTLSNYVRLLVSQHLRTPLKIELSQKAS